MNKQIANADEFPRIFDQPEEAEYIDGFRVTRDDLLVLAEHYLTECWNETYSRRFYPAGCYDQDYMLDRRLYAIRAVLGDHAFEEIQRRVDQKWRRIFKDAKRGLVCKACGVPQELLWGIDDGMCMECRDADGPQAEEHEESTSLTGSPVRD